MLLFNASAAAATCFVWFQASKLFDLVDVRLRNFIVKMEL